MIKNPVLPGFHSDPCICRRGDSYYIALSTFEWFPGVPVYHSKDLCHWELYTHLLNDADQLGLRGLPSAKGIWAPCLTWCEEDGLFYLVYGVMRSMNARFFDIDNYLITAPEITGPWSDPVYLHSAGFDASLLHDDDGRKWLVSLEWETRDGYRKPGGICLAEYSPAEKKVLGYPKRIYMGGTERGCLEGPHLYKHDGMYYLLCAEGGTGYYHSATMARSADVYGPYESDPANPILTSVPENHDETADTDHLKPRYYNPEAPLQKAGHGSLVHTQDGTPYLAFHCARPFVPELCCTLGRETALARMEWTADGWLRLPGGGNLVPAETEESGLPLFEAKALPERDDFDEETLRIGYYAPRIDPASFTDLTSKPGYLRMRGQQSLSSVDRTSLLVRKLMSLNAELTTRMEFDPEVYEHSAGLVFYYDNMNYVWLRKYYSETLGGPALALQSVERGVKHDYNDTRIPCPDGPILLKLSIEERTFRFFWSTDDGDWQSIGGIFDTWKLSDEYSMFGEFTGAMCGIACIDALFRTRTADFDFFELTNL